jgi:NADP-dependent 3-hydroxy acid dehydrogenase YdfG
MSGRLPRVLVIGTGNIGGALVRALDGKAEVLEASRQGGLKLDITSQESIRSLDANVPDGVDHVVVATGASTFGPLKSFDAAAWQANIGGKLMSVTTLVVLLVNETAVLRDGGSITVTSGQSGSTVNELWPGLACNCAGLDAFVRCAGRGLPRGLRLNAVSPALVTETATRAGMPTAGTVAAKDVAEAYLPLIFGQMSGEVHVAGAQVVFSKNHRAGEDTSSEL